MAATNGTQPGGATAAARKTSGAILTVDVGNTTTRFGLFRADAAAAGASGADTGSVVTSSGVPAFLGSCSLTTPERLTADEARIQLKHALSVLPDECVCGAILSCVVPSLAESWRQGLAASCKTRPLVVGPGLKTGLRMLYDDPSEVGSDRVADIVATRATYGAPAIVVDLGTTTNFEVIDASGAFAGGIIAPGVELGARSLFQAAARLPMIELRAPRQVIGRNTRAAMQSGVVLGEAARIDGLLDAIMAELSCEPPVVLTGNGAEVMATLLHHDASVDDTLCLRGLALLWQTNQR